MKSVPNRANGALARAQSMTPERRKEIASNASKARWAKKKAGEVPALEQDIIKPS